MSVWFHTTAAQPVPPNPFVSSVIIPFGIAQLQCSASVSRCAPIIPKVSLLMHCARTCSLAHAEKHENVNMPLLWPLVVNLYLAVVAVV